MDNELFGERHEQEENGLFGKRHEAEQKVRKEIESKEDLHITIDDMIKKIPVEPKEIGLCKSFIQYDSDMYESREYKGIQLTYYNEWFAKGKIIII